MQAHDVVAIGGMDLHRMDLHQINPCGTANRDRGRWLEATSLAKLGARCDPQTLRLER
jgi:hypothetical protein